MTQKAYEAFLDSLAHELGLDKIETDERDTGSFVLELDESRWVLAAYSATEDKLLCQMCLEPTHALDTDALRYLLRQNDLSFSQQQQHFSLIQESAQADETMIVLLLRMPIHNLRPQTFLQSVEQMVSKGMGVEAYLLRSEEQESDLPPVNQMALKA